MTVYFEGNGQSREAAFSEVTELFIDTVKAERDDLLASPAIQAIDDSAELALAVATGMCDRIFMILDGDHPNCPGFNMMPDVGETEKQEAIEAGGNWLPFVEENASIAGNLCEHFRMVNS
jgi:hypothetical protein